MIDRERRNQLATLIRRYLDGKADAADFEKCQLDNYISADQAIYHVSLELSYYSEKTANTLSKQDWDYLQRLLLLLDSNSTVYWQASHLRPDCRPAVHCLSAPLLFQRHQRTFIPVLHSCGARHDSTAVFRGS